MNYDKKFAVAGSSLSVACQKRLSELGFSTVILPPYGRLDPPVSSHADMLIFPIDGKFFTYGEYARETPQLISMISDASLEPIYVREPISSKYPDDVALNCLTAGKYIFSRNAVTSEEIIQYAKGNGYVTVNVKQGYARCTACPVANGAIITADPSIAKAAKELGFDVLMISQGSVGLQGYEYGFIGGACGVVGDSVFFAGNIERHPDGNRISEFCSAHSKKAISLSDEPLEDVGSIFFI